MKTLDWIVFDLGGIVVPECGIRIMVHIAHELGCPPERLVEAVNVYHDATTTGVMTLRQVYASALHDLSLDACPDTVLSLHLQLYREMSTQHDADMVALIDRLKPVLRVACLTNTEPETACISRETGLFDYFQRVYLSVDLGLKKPDRKIYETVLADTGCQPERMVFVDDREENVKAARFVGMHGLLFNNVTQLEKEICALCPSAPEANAHCSNKTSESDVQ